MDNTPAFEDFFETFMGLYQQGSLAEAQALLDAQAEAYPEWGALTRMWKIGLTARQGDGRAALQQLKATLDGGVWYHEEALANDPDLQPLADSAEFQGLVARSAALRKSALAVIQPECELNRPAGLASWPLLAAFHGNNNSIAASRGAWLPAVEAGWGLMLPQSPLPSWLSGHFNWNFPEALNQAEAQIAAVLAAEPVQTGRVVVGGFSMGAALALRLGLEGKQPISTVIAVEPWVPDPATWPPLIAECPLPGPRFILVGGKENSEYMESLLWMDDLLRTAGFSSTVIEASNTRHRLPDEFGSLLTQILAAI